MEEQNDFEEFFSEEEELTAEEPIADEVVAGEVIAEDVVAETVAEDTGFFDEEEDLAEDIERKKAAVLEAEAVSQRMKEEYMRAVKAEKQRKKVEARNKKAGLSAGACIGISAVVSIIVVVLTIMALFVLKMPSSGKTIVESLMSKYAVGDKAKDDVVTSKPVDTIVGETVVPGGSDVTINIEGDVEDLAAAVYAKCNQSIVGIRVVASTSGAAWRENEKAIVGEGSGVVYTADGYIITNHHVIAKAIGRSGNLAAGYEIRVYFDTTLSTYVKAQIVGSDETTDLALIKVSGENLTPVEVVSSETLNVGDKVYAIGSPGGLEFMNSLSDGIISGLNREVSTDTGIAYDLIQTNTAINPGNSGGALLNREGKLIGICFLKIVANGYEGMGFAISSDTVVEIIDELKENGKISRPVLGITVNTLYNETEAQASGLPSGVWIEEVTKGSAADDAGIEASSIITEFNGEEIKSYSDLKEELAKYKPGDEITLKVYCYNSVIGKGEYKNYKVILGEAE